MSMLGRALGTAQTPAGDGWESFPFSSGAPPPLRAGDRIFLEVEAPAGAHVYAVGSHRQSAYRKLWETTAPKEDAKRVRAFPGGRVLSADEARMDTLLVVMSKTPIPWLTDLTTADCTDLVGTMPTDPPTTACTFLYGLHWKVPPRRRGLAAYPAATGRLSPEDGGLLAAVSGQMGDDLIVVELQYKPRS